MRFAQKWTARAVRPDGAGEWFPAEVPGNVQYDYGIAMGWGDVNYGENVRKWRVTEDYTWEYRTVLSFEVNHGERAVFVSEGIDYWYEILIDGEKKLSHEGMFTPIEIDVTNSIGSELVVRILPHPKDPDARFEDRNQADTSVKPPVCYGWDWHPRLLVSGIWQNTYVETRMDGYIRRCEPFYTLNADRSRAEIRFDIECNDNVNVTLYDPDGDAIGTGIRFTIEQPRLWWCNGQGPAALYTWEASSSTHRVSGTIGLRTVRLVMNEGGWDSPYFFPKGRSIAPIQLELNGRRIFAKGSNWVNPDMFNGRINSEHYEALILLARDAHMNIFRCWGGSGINKKAFYELCDRMGIMVWVEFPLACNNYEGTDHYLRVLEQEATQIIRDLRSYACVVMWCGGNELFNNWSLMTDQSLPLRLLNKLCYELDRNRPFILTSPLFGMGHGNYTFFDPLSGKDALELFQSSKNSAYTEFGCSAIAETEVLKQIIPENELFPIRIGNSWTLHHGFDAWGEERWLCMDTLEKYAIEPLDSLDKVVALSNWLQCEGYKGLFEEARRQRPYCSMAINWDYCEPWKTAAGNNLIAYPARPKQCYHAVKAALRPVLASARIPRFDWTAGERFHAQLWLLNDSPETVKKSVQVRIRINNRKIPLLTWDTGDVQANTNLLGPEINYTLPYAPAGEIILILDTQDEAASEYRLLLRSAQDDVETRQMNV